MKLINTLAALVLSLAATTQPIHAQQMPPQNATPPEPILVGTTQSLSGRFAREGTQQLEGLLMWMNDINARGELLGRPVELVHYDDHSDVDRVEELYEKLITERKVDLLIGPYSSELTLRATEVAERHNFPIVTAGASADKIWSRGFRNTFGIDVPSSNYMDLAVEEAATRGAKTVALFYADGEFAQDVARGVRREARKHGLRLVMDREYTVDKMDFKVLGQELLDIESQADVVLGATYLDDSINIAKALGTGKRLEVDMVALTVGPALRDFSDRLDGNINGVVGVVQWLRTVRLPGAQDFSYRYRKMHGNNPAVYAAIGYSAGQVTEAAVRLAGSTENDAVREQLGSMRFRSLMGHYQVDETGRQVAKKNYLLQWQDGRRRLVSPENIAERELIYPRP
ncbi:MAG: amino acid ABC transporter substrate-binding protein [Halieaceae bacterium]|nr:amino acid ABC transporter substrate-binding protein [Halieaceae bacterium]